MTTSKIKKPADVPFSVATKISVDWLKLDQKNPRLVDIGQSPTEIDIIAKLYKSEELDELLQSIGTNGYLDIEPLIVCLDASGKKFTVLEGNRRLATIRLFRESKLIEAISSNKKLKITVPSIDKATMKTFDQVSVYRVSDREEARAFIGFKHINGAAKWESYAKARFAADWYKSNDNVSLEQIAQKIGDKHDTIKRMVAAIYVLEQAERAGIFSLSDRNETKINFSHLYTALARSTYREHLGLATSWTEYDPKPDPVSTSNFKRLREVLVWIYGSKQDNKKPIVQSQNPDIKNLGETLVNPEGLHMLQAGIPLEEAYASTQPADATLAEALVGARSMLRKANNNLHGYDGSDQALLNIASNIFEIAKNVFNSMKEKSRKGDKSDG